MVVSRLKTALARYERQRRTELTTRLDRRPLDLPPKRGGNTYYGFTYTVLVPALAFLPAFISGSIAADSVAEERERDTFELLRSAPLSIPQIVDGKALAFVAIAPVQVACWFAFLALNGTPIHHPLATLGFVTALTGLLVVGGIAAALAVPKHREAQLVYSFGALGAFGAVSLLPESRRTSSRSSRSDRRRSRRGSRSRARSSSAPSATPRSASRQAGWGARSLLGAPAVAPVWSTRHWVTRASRSANSASAA
ncbi:ABC transporter permease [Halarchaeum acidiphilum]|uniref:ABC transporter permease n=1 Tax=Halarchaeum acidiphilum TaxID=489138 RepID=UPI001900A0D4|nr:ABC transporter permease [Halarchaeum acidiphilum]